MWCTRDDCPNRDDPFADFPEPQRRDGKEPCGECHLQVGEVCDICGAVQPVELKEPRDERAVGRLLGAGRAAGTCGMMKRG